MKKISMLLAMMVMACGSYMLVSCGSDDSNNGGGSGSGDSGKDADYEMNSISLRTTVNMSPYAAKGAKDELFDNLAAFFQEKLGSDVHITNSLYTLTLTTSTKTAYANMKTALAAIKTSDLDAVVKKTSGVSVAFINAFVDDKYILDYTLAMDAVPTGTWSTPAGTDYSACSITINDNVVKTMDEYKFYEASLTYGDKTISGRASYAGYYISFESTDGEYEAELYFENYTTANAKGYVSTYPGNNPLFEGAAFTKQ